MFSKYYYVHDPSILRRRTIVLQDEVTLQTFRNKFQSLFALICLFGKPAYFFLTLGKLAFCIQLWILWRGTHCTYCSWIFYCFSQVTDAYDYVYIYFVQFGTLYQFCLEMSHQALLWFSHLYALMFLILLLWE